MRDGFVSVCAVAPYVRVADVAHNVDACAEAARAAAECGAKVVVLPELALTGCTCGDLFMQDLLLDAAEQGLADLADKTADLDALVLVGVPLRVNARLYDCCAALAHGDLLGVVPKQVVPAQGATGGGARHFAAGPSECVVADISAWEEVLFGANLLFACEEVPALMVAAEFGDDLAAPLSPSAAHALAGATLVCNLSATPALAGGESHRRSLVGGASAKLACGYVCANAGWGESTTDAVMCGHGIVAECGKILAESLPLETSVAISEVDLGFVLSERRRTGSFDCEPDFGGHWVVPFSLELGDTILTRSVDPMPFVPDDASDLTLRCEEVLSIQALGLARRLEHVHSERVVLGLSGGLDSTLALLVCVRAFDYLGLDRTGILAVTMPGFGTTGRTRSNATKLAKALGVELREIPISASVSQHFTDIGHDPELRDVTYENAQARERTQVLMDLANQEGGFVVGTGDLSELALGWATYNGDHMSMYGVNAGVPKTLVRHLVRHVADTADDTKVTRVLADVLDTPVSPELLPAGDDGATSQRTEDIIGPYELHDFFLYNMLRKGFAPKKVYRLALEAFDGAYDDEKILSWLKVFYKRFFSQQFKRSCLPDGPAVGSVGLSPRGGLCMPSDACVTLWLAELEEL